MTGDDAYSDGVARAEARMGRKARLTGLYGALPACAVVLIGLSSPLGGAVGPVGPGVDPGQLLLWTRDSALLAPELFGQVWLCVGFAAWGGGLPWTTIPPERQVHFGLRVGAAWGVRAGAVFALAGLAMRAILLAAHGLRSGPSLLLLLALALCVAFAGLHALLAVGGGALTGALVAVIGRISADLDQR